MSNIDEVFGINCDFVIALPGDVINKKKNENLPVVVKPFIKK